MILMKLIIVQRTRGIREKATSLNIIHNYSSLYKPQIDPSKNINNMDISPN